MAKPKTRAKGQRGRPRLGEIPYTQPPKKPPGRPQTYSQTIADEICTRIEAGESLLGICKSSPHIPTSETVRKWLCDQKTEEKYPRFVLAYTRARESQADTIYEEIQAIEDLVLAGELDPNAGRVLVDSKKWRAGKMKPKKYGDPARFGDLGGGQFSINLVFYGDQKPKMLLSGPAPGVAAIEYNGDGESG